MFAMRNDLGNAKDRGQLRAGFRATFFAKNRSLAPECAAKAHKCATPLNGIQSNTKMDEL